MCLQKYLFWVVNAFFLLLHAVQLITGQVVHVMRSEIGKFVELRMYPYGNETHLFYTLLTTGLRRERPGK